MLSKTLKKGFYMDATDFILIVFILFALTSILKSSLDNDKAIRISTYYSVFKTHNKEKEYDFEELLEKERKYYPMGTVISLVAYILSRNTTNEIIHNILVGIIFIVLSFSIYYLRPKKRKA
jgi:hypothetical protein